MRGCRFVGGPAQRSRRACWVSHKTAERRSDGILQYRERIIEFGAQTIQRDNFYRDVICPLEQAGEIYRPRRGVTVGVGGENISPVFDQRSTFSGGAVYSVLSVVQIWAGRGFCKTDRVRCVGDASWCSVASLIVGDSRQRGVDDDAVGVSGRTDVPGVVDRSNRKVICAAIRECQASFCH